MSRENHGIQRGQTYSLLHPQLAAFKDDLLRIHEGMISFGGNSQRVEFR